MKIQSLAIIFIILILPISLVLSSYTQSRVETISLQTTYDSRLNDATHDALKAYQVNSFSSDTSDYTNSKIRDIKAAVNTFFNSITTNFSTLGYTKETLQNYVPALVYTMYDGYYIYSPYKNTWSTASSNPSISGEMNEQITNQLTYSNGTDLYGLKPYVYYSCRYKKSNPDIDVTITYSLDNYIQIQGTIRGTTVSRYGYVLGDNLSVNNDNIVYNGITISSENALSENVYVDGSVNNYQYKKINGTKYYIKDNNIISVLNEKSIVQSGYSVNDIRTNDNAIKYYKEANNLKNFIVTSGLSGLKVSDIVNPNTGKTYLEEHIENPYDSLSGGYIFDFNNIESETSNFNTHRINVIKNSIIKNLSVAISNFNNYSGVTTDFQMPELKDTDWDKIMNNISVISFLQGVNIGGKVYNGYSIITNTENEDVVMEDSIYVKNSTGIHRITENNLDLAGTVGILNVNLEKRSTNNGTYYLPIDGKLSYDSIITQNNISTNYKGNMSDYVKNYGNETLKRIYYTALARERYGLYRQKLEI